MTAEVQRAVIVVACVVAALLAAPARAGTPDPQLVAEHWLEAMRTKDAKALAKLTPLPLVIASASINDGALSSCDHQRVTTRRALFAMAGDGNSVFAESASLMSSAPIEQFDCKREKGHDPGRMRPVPALAGSKDVVFLVGSAEVTLRISRGGQVVFVSVLHMSPGI